MVCYLDAHNTFHLESIMSVNLGFISVSSFLQNVWMGLCLGIGWAVCKKLLAVIPWL